MEAYFARVKARLEARPPRPMRLPGLDLKESAVLAPMFWKDGAPYLVFTQRPLNLRQHGGQVSFPGGSREPSDLTPLHTALRETQEELGIRPDQVEVLGRLDDLPTITEFCITPFVGRIAPGLRYAPSPDEVEEVLEVPVSFFQDAKSLRKERRAVQGSERDIYFYDYGRHVIWGATARIVRNLLDVIGSVT